MHFFECRASNYLKTTLGYIHCHFIVCITGFNTIDIICASLIKINVILL